ncbi:MAG: hypothetical protein SGILL_003025 [Bacillariaceae sp.]
MVDDALENDDNIQDDIIRLVAEHGDLDDIQQQPQQLQQQPQNPDPAVVQEEWDNVLPADLVDHPVILAFQESNANFLPRRYGVNSFSSSYILFADNPTQGFLQLTGYPVARVLGRNCRFLQGPETDPIAVAKMREAIDQGRDVSVKVLNYRYDGTTFRNTVMIAAIREPETSRIQYYVGLQYVSEEDEDEGGVSGENDENRTHT